MTVEVHGNQGANPWGNFGGAGLEDVNSSDMTMPRIQIVHDQAIFKDSSTGEEIDGLEAIFLGMVRQRIMWDTEVDDGDKPQCKSPDYNIGFPQMRVDIPTRKQFPWAKSNFDKKDFPEDENGQIQLPCGSCKLKEWGKDKEKPPCSEQLTFPILYKSNDGTMRPGIISFQRSALKEARTYAGTFAGNRQPMFTVWTSVRLTLQSRGKVAYSTPTFRRGEMTEQDDWQDYANNFYSAKEWLVQPPRPATKEADEEEAAKKAARPTPASATAATKLEEDDPWSTSGPTPSATPADDDLPF